MKTFMKSVILSAFLATVSFGAFAQCTPAPIIMEKGYQGGNPCWGGQPLNGQVVNNGQFVQPVNQQWLANQAIRIPVTGMPSGYCSWNERFQNVGFSALIGGVLGALAGDSNRAAGQGAALGLLVGTAVPCAAQQQYIQQQGFQGGNQVSQPVSMERRICPPNTSWRILDWVGHPKHGQHHCLPSDEQLQRDKDAEARARASLPTTTGTTVGHLCPANTSWQQLDWVGHPQHGKEACLNSEQVARDKAAESRARELVNTSVPQQGSVAHFCKPGYQWLTLDWPGHPQHGKGVCLNQEQVARDKAKFASNGS